MDTSKPSGWPQKKRKRSQPLSENTWAGRCSPRRKQSAQGQNTGECYATLMPNPGRCRQRQSKAQKSAAFLSTAKRISLKPRRGRQTIAFPSFRRYFPMRWRKDELIAIRSWASDAAQIRQVGHYLGGARCRAVQAERPWRVATHAHPALSKAVLATFQNASATDFANQMPNCGQSTYRPHIDFKGKDGGPRAIRTPDPQIRSLMLYPAELWIHLGRAFSPPVGALQGLFNAFVQRVLPPVRKILATGVLGWLGRQPGSATGLTMAFGR